MTLLGSDIAHSAASRISLLEHLNLICSTEIREVSLKKAQSLLDVHWTINIYARTFTVDDVISSVGISRINSGNLNQMVFIREIYMFE